MKSMTKRFNVKDSLSTNIKIDAAEKNHEKYHYGAENCKSEESFTN